MRLLSALLQLYPASFRREWKRSSHSFQAMGDYYGGAVNPLYNGKVVPRVAMAAT